jgi:hypothetical protein
MLPLLPSSSGEVYSGLPLQHHQQLSLQQQGQQQLNAYGHAASQSLFRDAAQHQMSSFSGQAQPQMSAPYLSSPTFGTLGTPQGFADELEEDAAGGMYGGSLAAPLDGQAQQSSDKASPSLTEGAEGGGAEQIESDQLAQAFEQLSTAE